MGARNNLKRLIRLGSHQNYFCHSLVRSVLFLFFCVGLFVVVFFGVFSRRIITLRVVKVENFNRAYKLRSRGWQIALLSYSIQIYFCR